MSRNLDCISDWDPCLPSPEELTPLSQRLIPHELASAFNIPSASTFIKYAVTTPSSSDALNTSQSAFESLLRVRSVLTPAESDHKHEAEKVAHPRQGDDPGDAYKIFPKPMDASGHSPYSSAQANLSGGLSIPGIPSSVAIGQNLTGVLGQGFNNGPPQFIQSSSTHRLDSSNSDMSHLKSLQPEERGDNLTGGSILEAAKLMQLKVDPSEEVESAPSRETSQGNSVAVSSEEQSARTLKKPRLVWTPQLHKRFVDAVAQLGIKHAVPKTIMQLMNVDGLTRENVASHLQKYRLYLKRMQGLSSDGPSSSDHLFASTPVPPSLTASAHFLVSQHGQHHDHAFGPVHNGALPRVLGNGVHHYSANISPSLSSFHGVNARAGFSTLGRLPHSPMLTGAEQGYMQQSSSQPGHMLTLFPSSGV